jgi:hypothetical protein
MIYVIDNTNAISYQSAAFTDSRSGVASGFGDLAFNLKHVLWNGGKSGRGSLAVGGTVRFPTGDALNYLGSGAYGLNLYVLGAYKDRFSPHFKIANQWNGSSVLLNPTGSGSNKTLPGGVQVDVGMDARVVPSVTVSVDLLGNQYSNAPSFTTNTPIIIPASSGPPTSNQITLPTVSAVSNTYTTANLSTGVKWKPISAIDLVVYGNLLTQLNDVGLRSDLVPSGGISYSFRVAKKR